MKTVLITGANRSIGFETAKQMAEAGYFVYVGSRNKSKGDDAVKKLHEAGFTQTESLGIDVSDPESVQQSAKVLASKIESLDVLINNAGILGDLPQIPSEISIENIKHVFDTNVHGVIRTTQAFLPLLKKSEAPRIVNVSSELGSLTLQSDSSWEKYDRVKQFAVYNISKSALNAYTVALAYELRDTPFKINSVTPGHTATDFNNYNGSKTVEEGARPIVKFATLPAEGQTGGFFKDESEVAW